MSPTRTLDPSPLVAPSGRTTFRAGTGVVPPRVLEQFHPGYTAEAMAARVEGTVVMEVLIDEEGRVPDARVIRSIPLLDRSALDTVKRWRFTPTRVDGVPVPVLVQIEMNFTLK